MTQDEIIRMAREAGFDVDEGLFPFEATEDKYIGTERVLERFAALVAAHVKSDQINTAYQQGCEDMKRRMEKRIQQLESQLQLCQTAVTDEREACAKVCENFENKKSEDDFDAGYNIGIDHCAAAIRARGN